MIGTEILFRGILVGFRAKLDCGMGRSTQGVVEVL